MAVDHSQGIGDHLAVRYQFDIAVDLQGGIGPRRSKLLRSDSDIGTTFSAVWSADAFQRALQNQDFNTAWSLLSCSAETALFSDYSHGVPRAQAWEPRLPAPRSKGRRVGSSVQVQQLQRLRRRLLHLSNNPDDDGLRCKAQADVQGLVASFPALARIGFFSAEENIDVVDDILTQQSDADRTKALAQWQDNLLCSFQQQSAWIKRKPHYMSVSPSRLVQGTVRKVLFTVQCILW